MKGIVQKVTFKRILKLPRFFLGQLKNVRRWITHPRRKRFFVIDLRSSSENELRVQFALTISKAIEDLGEEDALNLAVILTIHAFAHVSDLFLLYTAMPSRHLGHIEFFENMDDVEIYWRSQTQNLYPIIPLKLITVDAPSIENFKNSKNTLLVQNNHLIQERYFLKSFGKDRLVFFCDVTQFDQRKYEVWTKFLSRIASQSKDTLFFVLSKSEHADFKYEYPNVVFIKELGKTLMDLAALVSLSDAFIGHMDILFLWAIQRRTPHFLLRDDISEKILSEIFLSLRQAIELGSSNNHSIQLNF